MDNKTRPEDFLAYLRNDLPPDARTAFEAQLARSHDVRSQLEGWRKLAGAVAAEASARSIDPPPLRMPPDHGGPPGGGPTHYRQLKHLLLAASILLALTLAARLQATPGAQTADTGRDGVAGSIALVADTLGSAMISVPPSETAAGAGKPSWTAKPSLLEAPTLVARAHHPDLVLIGDDSGRADLRQRRASAHYSGPWRAGASTGLPVTSIVAASTVAGEGPADMPAVTTDGTVSAPDTESASKEDVEQRRSDPEGVGGAMREPAPATPTAVASSSTARLTIRLADEHGAPLAEPRVLLMRPDGSALTSLATAAEGGLAGELAAGQWLLYAEAWDRLRVPARWHAGQAAPEDATPLTLEAGVAISHSVRLMDLPEAAVLHGYAFDESGVPLSYGRIVAVSPMAGTTEATALTFGEHETGGVPGRFRLVVAPGMYRIGLAYSAMSPVAWWHEGPEAAGAIGLEPGELEIELRPGVAVNASDRLLEQPARAAPQP